MSKAKKVVFVGDAPSPLNTVESIAFVGADCFPRLIEWIKVIQPDYYVCMNSNELTSMADIHRLSYYANFKVIALGMNAAKRLTEFEIEHLMLPHPSGRNRQINDPIAIRDLLMEAREYVNE